MRRFRLGTLMALLLLIILQFSLMANEAVSVMASASEGTTPTQSNQPIGQPAGSSGALFIENVGQFDDAARFQVRGGEGTIWLAPDALWITRMEAQEATDGTDGIEAPDLMGQPEAMRQAEEEPRTGVNIKLAFVGANPTPTIEPFNRLESKLSYFIGNNPDEWQPDVPVWGGVRYVDLYPGVDLEVTSQDQQLQPRLVVQEGAKLDAVRLRVEGADELSLDGETLALSTAVGEFDLPLLQVVAEDGSRLATSASQAQLAGVEISAPFASSSATPRARSQQMASSGLLYSTFLGGSGADRGDNRGNGPSDALALDSADQAFLTGDTTSSDFPTTPGVYDSTHNGNRDVFVAKLSSDGSQLIYATLVGGSDDDWGASIAIDQTGSAYVTGITFSNNFPTTANAFDTIFDGGYGDVLLIKLNPNGNLLEYSTFLGTNRPDWGYGIAVDQANHVYATGFTYSGAFPTTVGAFNTTINGMHDGFVVKLNPAGTGTDDLLYSTFIGGSDNDGGGNIVVDGMGNAYITGNTWSTNFPTTSGALDTTFNGGDYDAYVVKLNANGSNLEYATFLGGNGQDRGKNLAINSAGQIVVTGFTRSTNFPTTSGAYDSTYNGNTDAFISKLNIDGSALVYSTFLGGSGEDDGRDLALNSAGQAIVTGNTFSSDFPTTLAAYDATHNGFSDGFISKLNLDGSALVYSTFLGGSDEDYGFELVLDSAEQAIVAGYTSSSDFPTTLGAYDTTFNGGDYDAFISKLALGTPSACQLYGAIGNHLVAVDQTTGDATDIGTTPLFSDIRELTFDSNTGTLFGVADGSTDPKLIRIDRATGDTTLVGPIHIVGEDIEIAESLAFNPVDGLLYGAVGLVYPYSNKLVTIDPTTGAATQIALITGTVNNEADALLFVNDILYAVDVNDLPSYLYTLDQNTGIATLIGHIGFNYVGDVTYNPETQTIFGSAHPDRLLITISPSTGAGTMVGSTHTSAEFGGQRMHPLTIACDSSQPNLLITKSGPTTAVAGDPITYTLTITNSGQLTATNLTITDTLPSGANYVSGGVLAGNVVSWNVPTHPPTSTTTVQFVVTATETITNSDYAVTADGGYSATGSEEVVTEISPSGNSLLAIYALAFDTLASHDLSWTYSDVMQGLRAATANDANPSTGSGRRKRAIVVVDMPGADNTLIYELEGGNETLISGLPDTSGDLSSAIDEYDMTDGATLGGFLLWARNTYPADKTTFSYVGHGGPLIPETDFEAIFSDTGNLKRDKGNQRHPSRVDVSPGFTDITPERKVLSVYQLSEALRIGTNDGTNPFDVADLVHCFASTIEAYVALHAYADAMTGSPHYAFFAPEMLGEALDGIDPSAEANAMADTIIQQYNSVIATYDAQETPADDHPRLLVALDSDKIPAIKQMWDQVSYYLWQNFDKTKIVNAYTNSAHYDTTYCEPQDWQLASPDALVDLKTFATKLGQEFGSPVSVPINTLLLRIDDALINSYRQNGVPWFADDPQPTWDFTGNSGIGIYADFVGTPRGGDIHLSWHAEFYNDTPTNDNPHPYAFLQGGFLGINWGDVFNRFWEGTSNLDRDACLPEFPPLLSSGELLVSQIIFPRLATVTDGSPVQIMAAISTAHAAVDTTVAFTVTQSSTTVFSDVVHIPGRLVTGTHPVAASKLWSPALANPAVAEPFTVEVMVDHDNHVLEPNEQNNVLTMSDVVWATPTNPRPVITATIANNLQWITDTTLSLNVVQAPSTQPPPVQTVEVQVYQYVAGSAPNTQVPTMINSQTFSSVSLPQALNVSLSGLTPGPVVLHVWGWSTSDVTIYPSVVNFNYIPPNTALPAGQQHHFLFNANAGDTLEFDLNALTGDPNMFLWMPTNFGAPTWSATAVGSDIINVNAPVMGEYLLSVYGQSSGTYTLTTKRNGVPYARQAQARANNPNAYVPDGRPSFMEPIPDAPEIEEPVTPTPTPTAVPPTSTPTPTAVPPTSTPTPTPTGVPPTSTPTPTGVPPTSTPTATGVPPTSTPTPTGVPPTSTPTPTGVLPTSTPTATGVPATNTPTPTGVPATSTPTATGVPATNTPTATGVPPFSQNTLFLPLVQR
ncbi:MAG: SBBP repeat-containing protein [Ardenticatenaceae bacterium]